MSYVAQQEHEAPHHLGRTAPPDSKQIRQKGIVYQSFCVWTAANGSIHVSGWLAPTRLQKRPCSATKKKLHQHKPQTIHRRKRTQTSEMFLGKRPGRASASNDTCNLERPHLWTSDAKQWQGGHVVYVSWEEERSQNCMPGSALLAPASNSGEFSPANVQARLWIGSDDSCTAHPGRHRRHETCNPWQEWMIVAFQKKNWMVQPDDKWGGDSWGRNASTWCWRPWPTSSRCIPAAIAKTKHQRTALQAPVGQHGWKQKKRVSHVHNHPPSRLPSFQQSSGSHRSATHNAAPQTHRPTWSRYGHERTTWT